MSIMDEILDEVNLALPQFNRFLLKDFRKQQIEYSRHFIEMTYREASKLFNGKLKLLSTRILSPEERIAITLNNSKYQPTVEIAPTELMLVEYKFMYEDQYFDVYLYMPYLKDDMMIINGAKYFIQFPLTDKVFYHINKDNGLGIKVLRAHLRFWRNLRHTFTSMSGTRYGDNVIIVKAHLKDRKYTLEDIKTALILYPLSMLGWTNTLNRYGIREDQIQFTLKYDKNDSKYDYFVVRKDQYSDSGLFMKVDKSILSTNPDEDLKLKMKVVTSILYVLQYLNRCTTTMYKDNKVTIQEMLSPNNFTIWKIILGKTIYGLHYASEIQVCGHAEQYLESLLTYLDPHTKLKLAESNIHCDSIYDLLDYVFINMDTHVVNYSPSDLFEKRLNIVDLIYGGIVQRIFKKIYSFTNNHRKNRTISVQDVASICRIGIKSFGQLHQAGSVVAINPSMYNDNYLLSIGARKIRTNHTLQSSKNALGEARSKHQSGSNATVQTFHHSWMVVEACLVVSHTNPDQAGVLNYFLDVDARGNIHVSEFAEEFRKQMEEFIVSA